MKVEVKNPNDIVCDAWVDVPTKLATMLVIDSDHRLPRPDAEGSWLNDEGMYENTYYFCWPDTGWWERFKYWCRRKLGRSAMDEYDIVTITAENDAEADVLRRRVFEMPGKRQMGFMYCDEAVYTEKGDKE